MKTEINRRNTLALTGAGMIAALVPTTTVAATVAASKLKAIAEHIQDVEAAGGWYVYHNQSLFVGIRDDGNGFPVCFWTRYDELKSEMHHIEDLTAAVTTHLVSMQSDLK